MILLQALLVAIVAWGAFAFGAVYSWAYYPLVVAAGTFSMAVAILARRQRSVVFDRDLTATFALFAIAAAVQLVPLDRTTLAKLSPETVGVLRQMDLAFAAGATSSHPLSISPHATATGILLFATFAALSITSAALFSARGADSFASALAVVGVMLALTGIVQQQQIDRRIYGFWTPIDGGSPYGPFVNKNHFAGWMLMGLPVTLGLLVGGIARAMRDVKSNWRDRVLWFSTRESSRLVLLGAAATVMALALVLTQSRSGVIGLAVAISCIGAVVARKRLSHGGTAVALAYLTLVAVIAIGWAGADVIASHFSRPGWSELDDRGGAWADASAIAARFPLTGTGLNSYGVATLLYQRHDLSQYYAQAHNDYLQLAAEGGLLLSIPGAACLLVFVTVVRRRFNEDTRSSAYWLRVGAVVSLASIAVQEIFDFSLQMPGNAALFAVVCGLALHRAPSPFRDMSGVRRL